MVEVRVHEHRLFARVQQSRDSGTRAPVTCRLRDAAPEFAEATCLAIACPACMTVELAKSCTGYVTTIINNTDIVPTISPGMSYEQHHTHMFIDMELLPVPVKLATRHEDDASIPLYLCCSVMLPLSDGGLLSRSGGVVV